MSEQELERSICAVICQSNGIKTREIAARLGLDHKKVNQILYSSPLMKELCWQDRQFCWHGLVHQERPHIGLQEFAAWYGTAGDFSRQSEDEWLTQLKDGCTAIGAGAFKNCANLEQISIPGNCTIGAGAFKDCGTVFIFAPKGSAAESYCRTSTNCVFIAYDHS